MTFSHANIVNEVRLLLSEPTNNNGAAAIGVSDNRLDLGSTIDTCIGIAVCLCSQLSPFGGVNVKTFGPLVDTTGTDVRYQPNDYIRLVSMKRTTTEGGVTVYHRPITTVQNAESPQGTAQYNLNTTGKDDNPTAVDVWRNEAVTPATNPATYNVFRGMEVFPRPAGMTYTIEYDAEYNGTSLTTYNAAYAHAVCYMAASLVMEVLEDYEAADRLRAVANGFLGIVES